MRVANNEWGLECNENREVRPHKTIALVGLDDFTSIFDLATDRTLAVVFFTIGLMHFMAETVAEEPYIFLTDLSTRDIIYALTGYRLVYDKEIKVRSILPSPRDVDELDDYAMDIWSRSQHSYGDYRDMLDGADCVLSFVDDLDAAPAIQYAFHREVTVCHYPPAIVVQEGCALLAGFLEDVVQPLGNLTLSDSTKSDSSARIYGFLDTFDFDT